MPAKAEILAQLQREILSLQGFKSPLPDAEDVVGLGSINQAFPHAVFPLSAMHEFICTNAEEATASSAFIAGLVSTLMQENGTAIWISASRFIFPPALKAFGLQPHQVIFLYLKKEKEVAWVVEEALKCPALTAVICDMKEVSFTASRRLQLAIEKSGVSCFMLRQQSKNGATTAVARWQIKPQQSGAADGIPGVGHPRWQVKLLKVRNGKPGIWNMEWISGKFRHVSKLALIHQESKRKTG
jgi:protein ImuA